MAGISYLLTERIKWLAAILQNRLSNLIDSSAFVTLRVRVLSVPMFLRKIECTSNSLEQVTHCYIVSQKLVGLEVLIPAVMVKQWLTRVQLHLVVAVVTA